ncbi:hypothetical protein AK812_SmicGene44464 [Symbiodinium microadriaticum]|uniref:Uncharacterized protein n=1 Tax=Symbiodinium microadriaticum TaxID=2951 RepID=A0A1Q9BYD4_SYMMI|nr:hypothetical protein AK812_SmicGene44464 [Symbiodinium microadriaticum]
MEFPHRISLLKRGLQDLEAGGCLSMGVSFVHLLETYSIIIAATSIAAKGTGQEPLGRLDLFVVLRGTSLSSGKADEAGARVSRREDMLTSEHDFYEQINATGMHDQFPVVEGRLEALPLVMAG